MRWAPGCWNTCRRSPRSGSSLPNKHHYLVDLSPFGLENPDEVYIAGDRPYGLIEATVQRDEIPAAPQAW